MKFTVLSIILGLSALEAAGAPYIIPSRGMRGMACQPPATYRDEFPAILHQHQSNPDQAPTADLEPHSLSGPQKNAIALEEYDLNGDLNNIISNGGALKKRGWFKNPTTIKISFWLLNNLIGQGIRKIQSEIDAAVARAERGY